MFLQINFSMPTNILGFSHIETNYNPLVYFSIYIQPLGAKYYCKTKQIFKVIMKELHLKVEVLSSNILWEKKSLEYIL